MTVVVSNSPLFCFYLPGGNRHNAVFLQGVDSSKPLVVPESESDPRKALGVKDSQEEAARPAAMQSSTAKLLVFTNRPEQFIKCDSAKFW